MLAQKGIEVALVLNDDRVFKRLFSPEMSSFFEAYYADREVRLIAAGDVANYQDVLFAKRRRLEHWDNAVSQGQYCARLLMGDRTPFSHVPYFFSDVFDLSYEYWGDSSVAEQVVHRGDDSSNSFSVWWLRQERVLAAFTMNRPDEERNVAPQWIEIGAEGIAVRT